MRGTVLGVAVLLLSASTADAAKKFHYTHRVTVTGHLVDHWTIDDPNDCGPMGDGTVTVDFSLVKPAKATPVLDRYHSSETRPYHGSWVLEAFADAFGHIGDMPSKPGQGTVDLVDNTVPRPSPYGDCGGGIDK